MIDDYCICVGLGCVIEPKIFTTHRDSQKYNQSNCQLLMFQNILKKQIPPSIVDELLQQNLDQLINEADKQMDKIPQAFMSYLIKIRQFTHMQIQFLNLPMREYKLLQINLKICQICQIFKFCDRTYVYNFICPIWIYKNINTQKIYEIIKNLPYLVFFSLSIIQFTLLDIFREAEQYLRYKKSLLVPWRSTTNNIINDRESHDQR